MKTINEVAAIIIKDGKILVITKHQLGKYFKPKAGAAWLKGLKL